MGLNMCKFDWEDRGGFIIVAFLHNVCCSGQMQYLPLVMSAGLSANDRHKDVGQE